MPVLTSEAVVLRTWPLHEADLIVSFFTRDYGRMKGVAKAALKSRKRFGGALEPMTLARAWFAERPRQELVRLDQLEILRSPLSAPVDHTRMAVLSFFAEVIDEALPERDPQETVFRLLVSVLEQTTESRPIPRSPISSSHGWRYLFLAMDDAADGPVAGHRPLHGVRRGIAGGGGFVLESCGWIVLRAAPERARANSRPIVGNWRRGCCGHPFQPLRARRGRGGVGRICGGLRCNRWNGIWSGS